MGYDETLQTELKTNHAAQYGKRNYGAT